MKNIPDKLPFYVGANDFPIQVDDGLLKGSVYSIRIQIAPTRLALINHALRTNLIRGVPCTLVTRFSLEELLTHTDAPTAQLFIGAIEERKLSILSMVGDYEKNMFRYGPKRFLGELEHFGAPHDSLIVMDHADSLFSLDDQGIAAGQAYAYRQWARKTGNIVLLLFLRSGGSDIANYSFQSLSDYFSGVAGLYVSRNGLEIGIDFWRLQGGIVMAKHIPVQTGNEGQLLFSPSLAVNRRNAPRPQDLERPANVIELSDGRHQHAADHGSDASAAGAQDIADAGARRWHYRPVDHDIRFPYLANYRRDDKAVNTHPEDLLPYAGRHGGRYVFGQGNAR